MLRFICSAVLLCVAFSAGAGCSSDHPTHRHEASVDVSGSHAD